MSAAKTFMARALREYGEALVEFHKHGTDAYYQRIVEAQNYLWTCAKNVAEEQQ